MTGANVHNDAIVDGERFQGRRPVSLRGNELRVPYPFFTFALLKAGPAAQVAAPRPGVGNQRRAAQDTRFYQRFLRKEHRPGSDLLQLPGRPGGGRWVQGEVPPELGHKLCAVR
jgi:hypothetical protein